MATRMLLISDTHVPDRSRGIPDEVRVAADAADLIIHAGDWTKVSVLDDLSQHGELIGVHGNNDGADLRPGLPDRSSTPAAPHDDDAHRGRRRAARCDSRADCGARLRSR